MANLGTAFLDVGRAEDALPLFDDSLAMFRRLARTSPTPSSLRSVAIACTNLGLAHRASRRMEEATVSSCQCQRGHVNSFCGSLFPLFVGLIPLASQQPWVSLVQDRVGRGESMAELIG